MIYCLRQLQDTCTEQDRPLYMVFVDFSKAFDTVGRTELWQLPKRRLVHLSADYARYSGTTTMCPCGLKARYTVESCCPPSYMEPRLGQYTDDR